MAGGHPPIFKDPEAIQQAIESYFADETVPFTITGLAYFLGFESRQSLYDYEKRAEYSYIIKRARLRVECAYEIRLNGDKPTGPIFALKNMGWSDKQEIDQKTEHSGGISITWQDPELPDTKDQGSSGEL